MRTELLILNGLLTDENFRKQVLPYLKGEYFHDKKENIIFHTIKNYVSKYNDSPENDVLHNEISEYGNISDKDVESLHQIVDEVYKIKLESSSDWLVDQSERFCQDKAVYNSIMNSIEIIDGKNRKLTKNAIPELLKDALAVSFDDDLGMDYIEDSQARFESYKNAEEDKLKFDLEMFNNITRGGIPKKTLNCCLGSTNVGKSLFLCHFAAAYASLGYKVLYISMEMAELELGKRIDSNLLNVPINQLEDSPTEVLQKRMDDLQNKITGKLIFKEFPTGGASVADFDRYLDELKLKKNFVPDVICVDYINICASSRIPASRSGESYMYIKSIAEELRGFAVRRNVAVWTATQTNRSGFNNTDPDLTNTSDSMGLPSTLDFMVVIITSDELEQLRQFKIKQLKNRYNNKSSNKTFCVGIDYNYMRLHDVSEISTNASSVSNNTLVHQNTIDDNKNPIAKINTNRSIIANLGKLKV